MKIEKLFHVLVIGGSLLSVGAIGEIQSQSTSSLSLFSPEENQEKESGLCSKKAEKYCEKSCDGTFKVKKGFECCWGTSCNDEE